MAASNEGHVRHKVTKATFLRISILRLFVSPKAHNLAQTPKHHSFKCLFHSVLFYSVPLSVWILVPRWGMPEKMEDETDDQEMEAEMWVRWNIPNPNQPARHDNSLCSVLNSRGWFTKACLLYTHSRWIEEINLSRKWNLVFIIWPTPSALHHINTQHKVVLCLRSVVGGGRLGLANYLLPGVTLQDEKLFLNSIPSFNNPPTSCEWHVCLGCVNQMMSSDLSPWAQCNPLMHVTSLGLAACRTFLLYVDVRELLH